MPLLIALAMIIGGLLIGALSGFGTGSILGGLLAAAAIVPAAYSAWLGVQSEKQTTLLWSILLILGSLTVGGLLIVLWLIAKVF